MENATPPPSSPSPAPFTPAPAPVRPDQMVERNWCMWCHLSALSGFVIPFGNVLGPLIIWQMKRVEFPAVEEHGKEALNFQLSVLIYLLGGFVLMFSSLLLCLGFLILPVLILAFLALHLGALILSVIAGIKANEGVMYRYPITLRLIK